jgi:hypothetical protein
MHPLEHFQEDLFKVTQGEKLEDNGRQATMMKRLNSLYRSLLDIISKNTLKSVGLEGHVARIYKF